MTQAYYIPLPSIIAVFEKVEVQATLRTHIRRGGTINVTNLTRPGSDYYVGDQIRIDVSTGDDWTFGGMSITQFDVVNNERVNETQTVVSEAPYEMTISGEHINISATAGQVFPPPPVASN